MGGGSGLGSGRLDESEVPRRGSGRCPGGQAKGVEDLGHHGRIYDGGDDRQGAAAVGALFTIDIEYPFEQPSPTDAGRRRRQGRVSVTY